MKKLSIFAAAAIMLVSCSNDELLKQAQGPAIGFDQAFVENSTRSVIDPSLVKGNFDFGVTAFMMNAEGSKLIFDNHFINADGSYSPTQYWATGYQYIFGAAAPYTDAQWTLDEVVADNQGFTNVEFSFTNADGTQDFAVARTLVDATTAIPEGKVGFTFLHTLAKAKFSFSNGFEANSKYIIKVSNITISDAYATGKMSYILDTDVLAWSNQAGTLELNFGNASLTGEAEEIAATQELESYKEMLLIPSPSTKSYTVSFTATVLLDNGTEKVQILDKTFNVTISNVELADGNCYDFKAVLNADNLFGTGEDGSAKSIQFEVTEVEKWTDVNNTLTVK